MPKEGMPKNPDRKQAGAQPMNQQMETNPDEQRRERMVKQRDVWLTANLNFAEGLYERFDSLEKSMNQQMGELRQSFNESVKTIQELVGAKELQKKVEKHDRLYKAVVTACNDS